MAEEKLPVLSDQEIEERLQRELPGWWHEGRWIRRKYNTDGWLTTLAVVNTIGFLAVLEGTPNKWVRGGSPDKPA